MPTAGEIMTKGFEYLREDATAADAAKRLAERSIGAVPVCDAGGNLRGLVTDRDIVVDVIAAGRDPAQTPVIDLVDEDAITVEADEPVEQAIRTMQQRQVRRLPVREGNRLVGILSQADIARACPPKQVGEMVAAISQE